MDAVTQRMTNLSSLNTTGFPIIYRSIIPEKISHYIFLTKPG